MPPAILFLQFCARLGFELGAPPRWCSRELLAPNSSQEEFQSCAVEDAHRELRLKILQQSDGSHCFPLSALLLRDDCDRPAPLRLLAMSLYGTKSGSANSRQPSFLSLPSAMN